MPNIQSRVCRGSQKLVFCPCDFALMLHMQTSSRHVSCNVEIICLPTGFRECSRAQLHGSQAVDSSGLCRFRQLIEPHCSDGKWLQLVPSFQVNFVSRTCREFGADLVSSRVGSKPASRPENLGLSSQFLSPFGGRIANVHVQACEGQRHWRTPQIVFSGSGRCRSASSARALAS
jgi:hypothetical protein